MTDLEIINACAMAMGLDVRSTLDGAIIFESGLATGVIYTPLTDDAQCMAVAWLLIQSGSLSVLTRPSGGPSIFLFTSHSHEQFTSTVASQPELRRAICETVAQLNPAGAVKIDQSDKKA